MKWARGIKPEVHTVVTCSLKKPVLTSLSWLSHFSYSPTFASELCLPNKITYSDPCFFQKHCICFQENQNLCIQLKTITSHSLHFHHPCPRAWGSIVSYLDYSSGFLTDLPASSLGSLEPAFHTWARMCFVRHKSDRNLYCSKPSRGLPSYIESNTPLLPVTVMPHLVWAMPASQDASETTLPCLILKCGHMLPPLHLLLPLPGKCFLHFLVWVASSHH